MARLTARRSTADPWLGLGLIGALVVLALVRIAVGGWGPLAPDDARYLYVGLSILDGRGPVNPSGEIFVLRSPTYGLALAAGSRLVGGDPLVGARLVAVALTLLGLAGALRLGWLLGGAGGAVGTALGLVATPLIWRLVPSLRIDLPQTAAIVAALLAVWRPTPRRWALGGVLIGVAILVKETALPLLVLPIALLGSVPMPRLARLAAIFVGAAVVTAAWWWIVVWVASGRLFPLNALSVIDARDVEVPLRLDRSAAPLLAAMVVGWVLVAWHARHDPGARLLLVAGAGAVPAALYAASLGLNARNFAVLAVLSATAIGAGGAWLVAGLRAKRRTSSAHVGGVAGTAGMAGNADVAGKADEAGTADVAGRAGVAGIVAAVGLTGVAIIALALPVIGQRDVGRIPPDRLGDELTGWLAANIPDGGRIVMAFREREETALRRFGHGDVAILPIERIDPAAPPDTYLWMGLRDRQLFGYRRAAWQATLTEPPADLLVLVGDHPFTPFELTATPETAHRLGLTLATGLAADGDRAEIYRIDPAGAAAGTLEVPLHLSAPAASAWLDLVGGAAASDRFLAARPIVTSDDVTVAALRTRLGAGACVARLEAGVVQFGPAGTCPD
jgi:hypothetical protein